MITTLMIFHAVISILLILMVLLQFGKGAEAGLFSGGGGDAVFTGSQQGNILSKITVVLAILFLGNSILLTKLQSSKTGQSLLDTEAPIAVPLNSGNPEPKAETAPKAPTEPAPKTETETNKADK